MVTQLSVLDRAYVPGVKVADILPRYALNTTLPLKELLMIIDPAFAILEVSSWLALPEIIISPSKMVISTVEPGGFVRTGAVREKVVDVPVEEICNDELDPSNDLLLKLGIIVMLPPFTLHVAGTVPVAVIVPLVAA